MSDVRLTVIYYSTYGTNHRMAEIAAEAARKAGAEVRLRKVRETAPKEVVESQEDWKKQAEKTADVEVVSNDDMTWANAYLFSSPTRYGGAASQVRAFIDTLGPLWMKGDLADKCVTAMTSAQNPHGGQETTLQTLYYTFMHWGCILVPPGYTDEAYSKAGGNPYGTSVTASDKGVSDTDKLAIEKQAKRLVDVTARFER